MLEIAEMPRSLVSIDVGVFVPIGVVVYMVGGLLYMVVRVYLSIGGEILIGHDNLLALLRSNA
jgi:hypothetical protein